MVNVCACGARTPERVTEHDRTSHRQVSRLYTSPAFCSVLSCSARSVLCSDFCCVLRGSLLDGALFRDGLFGLSLVLLRDHTLAGGPWNALVGQVMWCGEVVEEDELDAASWRDGGR